MTTPQDRGIEQRSIVSHTNEGSGRLRWLVSRLSRRDSVSLPMTLLLIGAVSAAQELSSQDEKQDEPAQDATRDEARTKVSRVEPQPGDKIAVLANGGKLAEHVLTKKDVAAGKVRIALRTNDIGEMQTAAAEAVVAEGDGAQGAPTETNATGAEAGNGAGTVVTSGAGAENGEVAAAPATQQGDYSKLTWLVVGLGALGAGIAAADDDDKHVAAAPPTDEEPPPPPPPTKISGQVIKGYLQGAAVFLDTDHDGEPDGEPVYTDEQGRFIFTTDQTGASLLAFGGVDTLTNVPLDGLILRAPADSTVVTPLTTLIDEMLKQDDSLSVDDAQSRLANALGLNLSEDVNLLTFDPLENLQNGGAGIEDHSESVLNTIGAVQSLLVGAGTGDAMSAAGSAIGALARIILEDHESLDLTSAVDIVRVLETAFESAGMGASSEDDLMQLASAIASVNSALIEASGLSEAALQAMRYALTGFQDLMTSVGASARAGDEHALDISFSHDSELASAIGELASGNVGDVINRNSNASISHALRLEGDRFVFAFNPELKLHEGAPDKIDTVTLEFDVDGVTVEHQVRGDNGGFAYQLLSPGPDGSYTLQLSQLDKTFITPPADFNGPLGVTVSVHYVGLDVVEVDTLEIPITPVNDAPTGQDSTVMAEEDRPYVFTVKDFPFTDEADGAHVSGANSLEAVKIVSLPKAGTLYLGDVAVTEQDVANGCYVSAADIAAGWLRFVPAADENGQGYAGFRFQVRDDGGIEHGGVALDPTARTLTVNVVAVNDEPTTSDNTLVLDEDRTHTFAVTDFAFTDVDGDEFAALIVASLPEGGTLWHGTHAITPGDLGEWGYAVPAADLAAGKFTFVPDADRNGSISFEYRVQDDGGTAHGGTDTSAPATFTFDITSVGDAPVAEDSGVALSEDGYHVFSAADFPFTDVDENDSFAALVIDSLPDSGMLYFDGNALTLDDLGEDGYAVSAQDLADRKLVFVPDETSSATASFLFRVRDSGLIENGGENTSAPATFTLTMTPPLGAPTGVSLVESALALDRNDGNTNETTLTYRVDLPEEGAYEGIVVQLLARGTDEPIAVHTLTAEDIAQGWASVQLSAMLGEGTHVISARFADASGTVHSELTAPFFTVVDRTAPAEPVLDLSTMTLREDDAESGFVVSGSAEAFATVEVSMSVSGRDPRVYQTTVAEDGRFQVAVDPSVFGETNITISAVARDRAGNASASDTATMTIVDALPAANVVTGTNDDEVFAGIAAAAVVFEPGLNGGNDYFIGSSTAFDTVRIAGNSADYTFTLVEGSARAAEATLLQGQGYSLLPDEPLYLIRSWNGGDWTEVRVQADVIQFDDAVVRLTPGGIVAGSDSGVTLHDEAGNERITGGAGHDTLFSHDGDDWLDGGSGNDTLLTIGGHDTLIGGNGDDTLVVFGDAVSAGQGNQVELYGGAGRDVFMIAPQAQFDRDVNIHDFVIGDDKIDLSWLRVMEGGTARELTLEDLHLDQLNGSLQEDGAARIDLAQFLAAGSDSPIAGILTLSLAGGASTLTQSDFILAASQSSLPGDGLLLQAYLATPL